MESTENDIDLLIATALTEEAQVVSAVMSRVAKEHQRRGHVIVHEYFLGDGTAARVATASAHQMGAVNMGVFIAPLLTDLRPRSTTLVGIAAAIDAGEVALGDVPFASQVLSYDDIAVEAGTLTFRTEGYQVDPRMRREVGALRTSLAAYAPWQEECLALIGGVIEDVSRLRRRAVKRPETVEPPHLIVGATAGGPFLLRDRGFSDSLPGCHQVHDHVKDLVSATEPTDRLTRELGDQLEVSVAVPQFGTDRLRSCGSEEIYWRRTAMVPTLREGSLHGVSSFAQVRVEWNEVQRLVLLGQREQLSMVACGA